MTKKEFTVLAIDDDADMLDMLRIILETNGYKMIEAHSAEQGLKKYKESTPDFILVDLMMEEVDAGVNFAKEIRLLNNKAPVYMLTSIGDSLVETIDYSQLGINGVLQKPLKKDNLLKILKSKLG